MADLEADINQDKDNTDPGDVDAKGAGALSGDGAGSDEDVGGGEGAPESYEDFALPEGVSIDTNILEEYQGVAKEFGLSQENAQKLVDLASKAMEQGGESFQSQQAEAWGEIRKGWVEEIKTDKEFGGDAFDETMERANRALRNFGSDNLIKFLSDTGYGDNPELIRLLAKVDKSMGEDSDAGGSSSGKGEVPLADKLFPGLNK